MVVISGVFQNDDKFDFIMLSYFVVKVQLLGHWTLRPPRSGEDRTSVPPICGSNHNLCIIINVPSLI